MSLIEAGIGAGAGIVGGIVDMFGGKSANEQNFEYQQKLMNMQNAFNVDMWNRQNAYNDPSAQMARLRAAGLNPNLVYGSGATTLSASAPSAAGSSYQAQNIMKGLGAGIPNAFANYMQAKMNDAAVGNLQASKELKETQASKTALEATATALKNVLASANINRFAQSTPLLIKKLENAVGISANELAMSTFKRQAMPYMLREDFSIKQTISNLNNAKIDAIKENVSQNWARIGLSRAMTSAEIDNIHSLMENRSWQTNNQIIDYLVKYKGYKYQDAVTILGLFESASRTGKNATGMMKDAFGIGAGIGAALGGL